MLYMMDTNTVSHLFRQHPGVLARISKVHPRDICISGITEVELLYGVAKRQSKTLKASVLAFPDAVTIYEGSTWKTEIVLR